MRSQALLRRVKLGCLDTLPERLALARTESLPYADFLTLLLCDEVERRDRSAAALRAGAKLDAGMRIDTFSSDTGAVFDRQSGTSCARCGSSTMPAALSSWDPWASGRRTWPRRSGTSRSVAAAPAVLPAPTSCSAS